MRSLGRWRWRSQRTLLAPGRQPRGVGADAPPARGERSLSIAWWRRLLFPGAHPHALLFRCRPIRSDGVCHCLSARRASLHACPPAVVAAIPVSVTSGQAALASTPRWCTTGSSTATCSSSRRLRTSAASWAVWTRPPWPHSWASSMQARSTASSWRPRRRSSSRKIRSLRARARRWYVPWLSTAAAAPGIFPDFFFPWLCAHALSHRPTKHSSLGFP